VRPVRRGVAALIGTLARQGFEALSDRGLGARSEFVSGVGLTNVGSVGSALPSNNTHNGARSVLAASSVGVYKVGSQTVRTGRFGPVGLISPRWGKSANTGSIGSVVSSFSNSIGGARAAA
jgi:hypothetical protein